ncbi:MAG: hypothetical protein M3X11_23065 [Acidobacteriota bacterium]|nr:hypothetical protein [Acidobacteriota bacterium]
MRFASIGLLLCLFSAITITSFADQGTRDPLSGLKRAISQANAPALTTQQETDITALITAYKAALPDGSDDALEAAREAFDAAILASNAAAAQAQAVIIANRTAALLSARLRAEITFEIGVLASLKNGGQLDALTTKYGSDRVLGIVRSLAGGGGFDGGRPGGPGRH